MKIIGALLHKEVIDSLWNPHNVVSGIYMKKIQQKI